MDGVLLKEMARLAMEAYADNQPLFPINFQVGSQLAYVRGASLRDLFAAVALNALISREACSVSNAARFAWEQADAMMKKRKTGVPVDGDQGGDRL